MKQFKNEIWDGKIWKKNWVCHCSQTFTLCSLYMTTILLHLKPYSAFIGKLKINKRDNPCTAYIGVNLAIFYFQNKRRGSKVRPFVFTPECKWEQVSIMIYFHIPKPLCTQRPLLSFFPNMSKAKLLATAYQLGNKYPRKFMSLFHPML